MICMCHTRRASGRLELYQLPAMQLVFSCAGVAEGAPVLSGAAVDDAALPESASEQPSAAAPGPVVELRLESFPEVSPATAEDAAGTVSAAAGRSADHGSGGGGGGAALGVQHPTQWPPGAAPHLLVRLGDGTLLAYRAFSPRQVCPEDLLRDQGPAKTALCLSQGRQLLAYRAFLPRQICAGFVEPPPCTGCFSYGARQRATSIPRLLAHQVYLRFLSRN